MMIKWTCNIIMSSRSRNVMVLYMYGYGFSVFTICTTNKFSLATLYILSVSVIVGNKSGRMLQKITTSRPPL